METACLARWLCDPSIRPSERLRRGVAAQLADLNERALVEDKSSQSSLPQVLARQRMQTLRTDYARRNLGKLPKVPGHTRLVDMYALPKGGAELIYRLLSAAAHGKQWAMLPMGSFAQLAVHRPRQSSHVARIQTNPAIAGMLTELSVWAVELALADVERYGGLKPPL